MTTIENSKTKTIAVEVITTPTGIILFYEEEEDIYGVTRDWFEIEEEHKNASPHMLKILIATHKQRAVELRRAGRVRR